MANSPQAKKRIRQAVKRTETNRTRRGQLRTSIKSVEEAIAKGSHDEAVAALRAAQPTIMRGVTKGTLHRNTAARKVSRLSKRIAALSGQSG